MADKLSNCHNAPVTIGGVGDFDDRDRVSTQYYVCSECSKPCDLADTKDDWLDEILQSLTDVKKYHPEAKAKITRRMEQEKLEARIDEAVRIRQYFGDTHSTDRERIVIENLSNRIAALKKGES